ncbi:MAG TPA: GNAT family N-acetyltransferase [Lentzea sp.]
MRYQLVRSYTFDDGSEVVEVVARAIDVDGLFSGPVPVERERVVLRGCPPSFADLAGRVELEVGVGDELQWWELTDLVVHGTVPNGELVDVVATAGARLTAEGVRFGPAPRHLLSQNNVRLGHCLAVDGFPRAWEEHDRPPVTLIGADRPDLPPWKPRKDVISAGGRLQALDRNGRIMADLPFEAEVRSASPSALGDGLFDVVLDQCARDSRPAPSARAVWDLWREGVPARRNLWARFDADGRRAWGDLTFLAREEFDTDRMGGVYELDGRHVTDEPGLHLAMSEALVGPGGYFGRGYDAFEDCLCGGWGVKPGFTLVWNDAQVAHEAIRGYFLDILKLLRRNDITVELKSSTFLGGVRELDRRTALGALADRWVSCWVKAAGLAAEPHVDARNVLVDQPGMRVERVLTDAGATAWHSTQLWEGDWITVPTTTPDEVASILSGAGLTMQPRETFMRRALADHPAPQAPEGYEVRVTGEDVIEVVLTSRGEEAASGLIAVVGEDAVPHRIRTSPEHRRRGLGSVVMGVLVQEAVRAGAVDGLLFATEEGLHLYRKLGWEVVSDVVIASNTKGEA